MSTSNTQSPAGAPAWQSNTSLSEMASMLRTCRTAVVLTHAKPDGDAIGSSVAVAHSLRRAGVNVECWFVGPSPRWLTNMTGGDSGGLNVRELSDAQGVPESATPDAVVIVDTGSWPQLAEVRGFIEARLNAGACVCVVDHHLRGDVAARRLIDSTAASCTQVLAPLCCELVGCASPAALPKEIAEALYLGLATDTGWFRFSSVMPATLRLAAELMQAGVEHTRLYRMIEQQDHAARWKLFGRALRTLELHRSASVATMLLHIEDFEQTGATPNDTSGFADMMLTIASVELSCVLIESPSVSGPLTKISLRSKPGERAIDVNELASRLGGGGHARAAGAKVNQAPEQAVRTLVEAVR